MERKLVAISLCTFMECAQEIVAEGNQLRFGLDIFHVLRRIGPIEIDFVDIEIWLELKNRKRFVIKKHIELWFNKLSLRYIRIWNQKKKARTVNVYLELPEPRKLPFAVALSTNVCQSVAISMRSLTTPVVIVMPPSSCAM